MSLCNFGRIAYSPATTIVVITALFAFATIVRSLIVLRVDATGNTLQPLRRTLGCTRLLVRGEADNGRRERGGIDFHTLDLAVSFQRCANPFLVCALDQIEQTECTIIFGWSGRDLLELQHSRPDGRCIKVAHDIQCTLKGCIFVFGSWLLK